MKKRIILIISRWLLVIIAVLLFVSIFWSFGWVAYLLLLLLAVVAAGAIKWVKDDVEPSDVDSPVSKEKQRAAIEFIEDVKKGSKAQFIEKFGEQMFNIFVEKELIGLDDSENWTAPVSFRGELYKWVIYT